jgi:hypothetical protein
VLDEVNVTPTGRPLLARAYPVEAAKMSISRKPSGAASITLRMSSFDGGSIFLEPSPRGPITLVPRAAFVAIQS